MRIIQISKSVTTDRKLAPKLTPVIEAAGSLDWHHGITGYFSEMQILGPHPHISGTRSAWEGPSSVQTSLPANSGAGGFIKQSPRSKWINEVMKTAMGGFWALCPQCSLLPLGDPGGIVSLTGRWVL